MAAATSDADQPANHRFGNGADRRQRNADAQRRHRRPLCLRRRRPQRQHGSEQQYQLRHSVRAAVHPPCRPGDLSVSTPGVDDGGTTAINNNLTFHVTGVTSGLTVAIYADGNPDPIGTAVASGDTVDVQTTVQLADGLHTFTVKQSVHYGDTTVGNRTIAAGDLYSDPSLNTVQIAVDTPATDISFRTQRGGEPAGGDGGGRVSGTDPDAGQSTR